MTDENGDIIDGEVNSRIGAQNKTVLRTQQTNKASKSIKIITGSE